MANATISEVIAVVPESAEIMLRTYSDINPFSVANGAPSNSISYESQCANVYCHCP